MQVTLRDNRNIIAHPFLPASDASLPSRVPWTLDPETTCMKLVARNFELKFAPDNPRK